MPRGPRDPRTQVAERPVGKRFFPIARLGAARRWEQTEIDVHRLERTRAGFGSLDMASGNVAEKCAMRGGQRRQARSFAESLGSRKPGGEQANGCRFHIALAASDLAGKAQTRHSLQPQRLVEQPWRIEESVGMEAAKP